MAVTAAYTLSCNVTEELADAFLAASQRNVLHNGLSFTGSLNSSTQIPATKVVSGSLALTAGAGTLDLRALTGTNGGAVDLNGLKIQLLLVRAKAANANAITLGEGAANGYELLGNGWTVTLQPGQALYLFGNEQAPDVAAAARTIDLAGTGTQGVDFIVVAG